MSLVLKGNTSSLTVTNSNAEPVFKVSGWPLSGSNVNYINLFSSTSGNTPSITSVGPDGNLTISSGISNGIVKLNSMHLATTTVGFGLRVAEGSNAKQGTTVLVAGSKVVANTAVTANSRIFLTSQADGGTPGFLRVSSRVAGTSFTITSSSGTDTSTVAYEIFEPG
jgi:hypothetical protein